MTAECPSGAHLLQWRDLQLWWAETYGIEDAEEAKKTLYRRLHGCLPENSPPQRWQRTCSKIPGAIL